MTVNEIIDALGGTTATAHIFSVLPSAVSNWRKFNAFPARLHYRLSKEAKERGLIIDDAVFEASAPSEVA